MFGSDRQRAAHDAFVVVLDAFNRASAEATRTRVPISREVLEQLWNDLEAVLAEHPLGEMSPFTVEVLAQLQVDLELLMMPAGG